MLSFILYYYYLVAPGKTELISNFHNREQGFYFKHAFTTITRATRG